MKKPVLKLISFALAALVITAPLKAFALEAVKEFTVNVTVESDNVTLAHYSVKTDEIVNLSDLGGDRAAFTANSMGEVVLISVNGMQLKADEDHTISVFHNNKKITFLNSIRVADGDSFVFRHKTEEVAESSKPVSSSPGKTSSNASTKNSSKNNETVLTSSKEPISSENEREGTSREHEESKPSSSQNVYSEISSKLKNDVSSTYVNPNKYKWSAELSNILEEACSWLILNDISTTGLIALSAAGQPAGSDDVEKFLQDIKDKNGEFRTYEELFYAIIAATFCGVDAQDVRGVNLIEKAVLASAQFKNNPVNYAGMLIAIDSGNYIESNTAVRTMAVSKISALQNENGGFGRKKGRSDSESTATVLSALSNYKELAPETVAKAVNYISNRIKYSSDLNSIEISKFIIAINSLNLNMDDQRFLRDGKNLVKLLKEYINDDSGFKLTKKGNSDMKATEYAVLALVALKNGMSPYRINYQTQDAATSGQPQKSNFNIVLTVIIAVVFVLIIVLMIAVSFYFRKKRADGGDDTIKFIFDNRKK